MKRPLPRYGVEDLAYGGEEKIERLVRACATGPGVIVVLNDGREVVLRGAWAKAEAKHG